MLLDPQCVPGWQRYRQSCYKFVETKTGITWPEAEALCVEEESHLVSIMNQEEMMFLHYFLTTRWHTGEAQTFIGMFVSA